LPVLALCDKSRLTMNLDLYSKRFLAALVLSCLLHAALVLMPYLGTSAAVSWPVVRGAKHPGPARILTVRLLELEAAPAGAPAAESPARPAANDEPRPVVERAAGVGLLPIPAPAYYTTDQLTKRPLPMSDPKLDVPEIGPIFASGKVILKIWINELGIVKSVDIEKSDLPEAISATAAAAFGKLRFIPGEINGRPVGSSMRVEVTYGDGTRPPPGSN
jgi:outer membrane biosynthesis protein TonB